MHGGSIPIITDGIMDVRLSELDMSDPWQRLVCNVCRLSMGVSGAAKDRRCKHCGSDSTGVVESFDDAAALAASVASSNLPKSIRAEFEEAIASRSHLVPGVRKSDSFDPRRLVRDSTVEGEVTLDRAVRIAGRYGVTKEEVQGILEMAAMEGVLMQIGDGRWRLLEQ